MQEERCGQPASRFICFDNMLIIKISVFTIFRGLWASMSVFVFLPVVFYKNVFVFLDLLVFCKNVLSYFKKLYVSVSKLKYAYKNLCMLSSYLSAYLGLSTIL